MHETFNLSHDLLAHIPSVDGKLYSYDLSDNIQYIDVESPSMRIGTKRL